VIGISLCRRSRRPLSLRPSCTWSTEWRTTDLPGPFDTRTLLDTARLGGRLGARGLLSASVYDLESARLPTYQSLLRAKNTEQAWYSMRSPPAGLCADAIDAYTIGR
jgi:hypothetical protein